MHAPEPDPDDLILRLLAAGNVRAIDTLHERYYEKLFFSVRKHVRHDHEAASLVNDVLIAIWEKRDTLKLQKPLLHYLYRAAHHRRINFLRDQGRLKEIPTPPEQFYVQQYIAAEPSVHPPSGEDLLLLWTLAELHMTFRVRQTFLMSRKEGKSKEEIAEALGITVNAVEKNMSRAWNVIARISKQYFALLAGVMMFH